MERVAIETSATVSVQAQPSCRAADDEDQLDEPSVKRAINFSDLSTSAKQDYFAERPLQLTFSLSEDWWASMLDSEFKKQRAQVVRELAEMTNDPFIKKRLLALVSRYDDIVTVRPATPIDLEFQSKGIGPER
jgi:hypothetical protein